MKKWLLIILICICLAAVLTIAIIAWRSHKDGFSYVEIDSSVSTSTRLANDPNYHPIVLMPPNVVRVATGGNTSQLLYAGPLVAPFGSVVPPVVEIDPYSSGVATSTLSNFSFEYPASAHVGNDVKTEGVLCPGVSEIIIPLSEDKSSLVMVSTSPSTACTTFNPYAATLADYELGYRQRDFEEVIDSQEGMIVNGIMMLRQVYSHGYWRNDGDSPILGFDLDIGYAYHYVRYVFFDGSKFVIVSGDDRYMPRIVQSIHLIR